MSVRGALSNRKKALLEMVVGCDDGRGLRSLEGEASDKGEWVRFRYTCCQLSEIPSSVLPVMSGDRVSLADDFVYLPFAKGYVLFVKVFFDRKRPLGEHCLFRQGCFNREIPLREYF